MATWFYSNWQHRVPITISNSDIIDYENKLVKILLNTEVLISTNVMNSDCSDIILTEESNANLLRRYIKPDTENTTETEIYVYLSELPVGSKTIYLYYGNENAITDLSGNNYYLINPLQNPLDSHLQLKDLDYESSGHTGFASADETNYKIELLENINRTMGRILLHLSIMTDEEIGDGDIGGI